jgi:hypothetical protein
MPAHLNCIGQRPGNTLSCPWSLARDQGPHHRTAEGVKLEHHNHKSPGFLRVTVTPDRLVGEYFTAPGPGREGDAEERDDHFRLDLKKHRLS